MKNLILSGGIYHPFEETSLCVSGHLEGLGLNSTVAGVEDGLALLQHTKFDLVTINALAFSMVQAEKYAPLRDRFAFDPSEADRRAMTAHIDRGGGLLGLHTAAICFDTWPQWGDMLGAKWVWGKSHHPAPNRLTVDGPDSSFEIWDELYCDLQIADDATILAVARSQDCTDEQPVLTVRERSAFLSLGHDMTATHNAGYAGLLKIAAQCALGRTSGGQYATN